MLKGISKNLVDKAKNVLGDDGDNYDDGEELFDAARDFINSKDDDETLEEEEFSAVYSQYEDLLMMAHRGEDDGHHCLVSPRTITEYQNRLDEARNDYLEALIEGEAVLSGEAVIDLDDFDDEFFETNGFTIDDLRRLYEIDEGDDDAEDDDE